MKNVKIKSNKNWVSRFIQVTVYGSLIIVPLFFTTNHTFPFFTAKYLLIILTALLLLGLVIYHNVSQNNFIIRITPLSISLFFFSLILIITSITSLNPHRSWFGDLSLVLGTIYYLAVIICAISVSYSVRSQIINERIILKIIWITGLVVNLLSYLPENTIKYLEKGATLGNTSYLGAYLLITAIVGIGFFISSNIKSKKIWYGIGIGSIFLNPLFFGWNFLVHSSFLEIIKNPWDLTGIAQAASIGLSLGIIVIILLLLVQSNKKYIKYFSVSLLMGIVGLIGYVGIQFSQPQSDIYQLYVTEKSPNRILFWNIANQGFFEKPLLGYGPGNYDIVYQQFFSSEIFSRPFVREVWVQQPHNIIWEYAVTTGIFGLISYLSLFLIACITCYRICLLQEKEKLFWGVTFIALLVGYFIQNLFGFDTPVPFFIILIIIGIINAWSPYEKIITFKKLPEYVIYTIKSIIIIGIIIGIFILFIRPWKEVKSWAVFTSNTEFSELGKNIGKTEKVSIIGDIQNTSYFIEEFLKSIQRLPRDQVVNQRYVFLEQIDGFSAELERQLLIQGGNMRTYLVLGILYNFKFSILEYKDNKVLDKSIFYLEKALQINRENPLVYIHLSQAYLFYYDFDKAITYARSAIVTAPEFEGAYTYAENMNELLKNKSFKSFIDLMRNKWNPYTQGV